MLYCFDFGQYENLDLSVFGTTVISLETRKLKKIRLKVIDFVRRVSDWQVGVAEGKFNCGGFMLIFTSIFFTDKFYVEKNLASFHIFNELFNLRAIQ